MGSLSSKSEKSSESQLRRTNSFIGVRRSKQRTQFKNLTTQLRKISRTISNGKVTPNSAAYSEILENLEAIRGGLNATYKILKDHNKREYEETLKLFDSVDQLFRRLGSPISLIPIGNNDIDEEKLHPVEESPKTECVVELRRSTSNCSDAERAVTNIERFSERSSSERSSVSKVAFGIQVMPPLSEVTKNLLKRSTLPTNPTAKAELENIRNTVPEVHGSILSNNNEKVADNNLSLTRGNLSVSTEFLNFVKDPLVETEIQTSAIKKIEIIGNHIAELENEVLYFKGKKGSEQYFELHELFVKYLIDLDSIEVYGNPIIRQEKRSVINRIQELLSIFKKVTDGECKEVHF